MEIKRWNKGVKITLTVGELSGLGLEISDFEKGNLSAKIFLSGLIVLLKNSGFSYLTDEVSATVSKLENSIIIRLVPVENQQIRLCAYVFESPHVLTDFCKTALKKYQPRIESAELFYMQNKYFLVIKFKLSKAEFSKKAELNGGMLTDRIQIAKIREYGTKLSRTPLEKILNL